MNAAIPPAAWELAMACSATVVLPLDSGPKTSTILPRGSPPMPSATSRAMEPVGITSTGITVRSPRRITEPLPNCLSICARARSSALSRSGPTFMAAPDGVFAAVLEVLAVARFVTRYTLEPGSDKVGHAAPRLWTTRCHGEITRTRVRMRARHAVPTRAESRRPGGRRSWTGQRSLAGTRSPYAEQTARQTTTASSPSARAWSTVRPESWAITWSAATLYAYPEPKTCSIRDQKSVRRTSSPLPGQPTLPPDLSPRRDHQRYGDQRRAERQHRISRPRDDHAGHRAGRRAAQPHHQVVEALGRGAYGDRHRLGQQGASRHHGARPAEPDQEQPYGQVHRTDRPRGQDTGHDQQQAADGDHLVAAVPVGGVPDQRGQRVHSGDVQADHHADDGEYVGVVGVSVREHVVDVERGHHHHGQHHRVTCRHGDQPEQGGGTAPDLREGVRHRAAYHRGFGNGGQAGNAGRLGEGWFREGWQGARQEEWVGAQQ